MMLLAFLGLLLGADAKLSLFKKLRKNGPPPPPVNRTTTEEDYWKQWEDFRDVSGKRYLTQDNHNERFEIFKDNVDKINRHNAKKLSWFMKVTQFADLTQKEFGEEIVGGCTKPKRTKENSREVKLDTSDNPDTVDWVTAGKVTPVKNQGQCGSCWAFSTTGCVEARYAIAKGTLNSLSEQELVDCAGSEGNNGCRGGLMDYGFEYVQKNSGLCSEASFPYTAKTQTLQCNSMKSSCAGGHEDPISGYQDVPTKDAAQMEAAVAQGPVSIAIEADQSAFQLYGGGVFSGVCGSRLDHGVLAVGYSNTGEKYWKVKNSWGANWGENGYIRLCKDCDKNRGKGQCGLLGQPSYATI